MLEFMFTLLTRGIPSTIFMTSYSCKQRCQLDLISDSQSESDTVGKENTQTHTLYLRIDTMKWAGPIAMLKPTKLRVCVSVCMGASVSVK